MVNVIVLKNKQRVIFLMLMISKDIIPERRRKAPCVSDHDRLDSLHDISGVEYRAIYLDPYPKVEMKDKFMLQFVSLAEYH